VNKIKPWFKRFEVHGNPPAALEYGTVVNASKNKPKEVDRTPMRTESRRAPKGSAMTANTRRSTNNRYLSKEVDNMRKTGIKTVLVLVFAALAISTVSANEYYLVPDNSSVPEGYCNTTEVGIWVNATESITSGFFNLTYTCCCANFTQFTPNTTVFDVYPGMTCGFMNIGFDKWSGGTPVNVPAAHYHLGNITIHCCSETPFCETDLNFNETILVWFDSAQMDFIELDVTTDNGTFTCGTQASDLIVTGINSYHYNTGCPAWFNLTNEIDVTVKNDGLAAAGASSVSLYIDGLFFGELPVSGLDAGASETVTFENWKPIGADCLLPPCNFAWSYKDYNLTAVADCDNDVAEGNETNNETTVVDRTCYNGYTGDEPLENVAHGMLNGGVLFTTGDSVYTGLYQLGSFVDAHYDITLPEGAGVELAHLNVYYTWHYEMDSCPQMEVSITNATGTHILPLEKAYNDLKCTCPGAAWVFPWGNYVYDLTDYIQGSGSYTVTVKRTGGPSFCVAARGINLVYEDQNASLIEYWINEGADKLIGGRRSDGGSLAWWECINNATFPASTETYEVVNATLGVVSPWAGSSWSPGTTNHLFFNGIKLGTGVYHDAAYLETIDSLTMHIGASNAQVGVNVTSVTDHYLKGSANMVGQCDDGDCMMPANAFFVVEYSEQTGLCGDVDGMPGVTTNDGRQIFMYLLYSSQYPGQYPLADEWAADCDGLCDGITTNDGRQIFMKLLYPGQYLLECC
jgi:hypothetical protein